MLSLIKLSLLLLFFGFPAICPSVFAQARTQRVLILTDYELSQPENLPPRTLSTVTTFDWRQLQRWNVDQQKLLANSIIRFETRAFWALYQWFVIAALAGFVVQALLIIWLLITRSRRRQAEIESRRLAALAQTQHKRLDEIVGNVPGVVWETRIDSATGERRTIFVSDHVEKMLGYSTEEWLSTPGFALKIIHEEDRERITSESEAIIAGKHRGVLQFRWLAKDGRVVEVEAHLAQVLDEAGQPIGVRGVTLDITEQHAAEERNRAILEAIPDLMFLQTIEGTYLDYHVSDPKDLFVPPEAFLGKNMREVLPLDVAEALLQHFRQTEQGQPQILEYELDVNGIHGWFEARLVRTGNNILSMVRDVSSRKRATDDLRLSEERFAKAFRANPQPMSLTRIADGLYLDVNESFLQMSGYTREEVIGRTSLELGVWKNKNARADFIQQLNQRGCIVNLETKFRTKAGRFRVLLSSAEKLDIANEQCLLISSSDITDRVAAQQALRESEERFRNMADSAPVMIWISGEDKKCTYFNRQWLVFTGRSMEEELGDGWTNGVYAEDYDRCLEIYQHNFDERKPFEMEYRLRRNDGEYRWIYDTGIARFSSDNLFLGYIGSCIDITERKVSEVELLKAHEELHGLKNQLEAENIYLQEELETDRTFGEIIGESDAIKYVLFKIAQVAPTDSTVLITGETGTGKELVARAIHGASSRKDRPLIKVNCGALSPTLIESELFGHEKGAFTGAGARRPGRFELANSGTIFLDEIGELPLELQVKLLRVIQENEFERLGGNKTIKADVRIIAATNRNLKQEVEKGNFREDLWYRLNVYPITVPPLRQRKDDIPLLVEHFVNRYAKKAGKTITSVSPRTMHSLQAHSWPGNVREVANVIERSVIHTQRSVLQIVDRFEPVVVEPSSSLKSLEEVERDYIVRILEDTGWRIEGPYGAAKILCLNPSTLRTRMLKLGIQRRNAYASANDVISEGNSA